MKELFVKIPEESAELVTSLLQKLGVEVEERKVIPGKKKNPAISPTFLFGEWKNIDLDAKELRKKHGTESKNFS